MPLETCYRASEMLPARHVSAGEVVVLKGAASWGAHERGSLTLPHPEQPLKLQISYDEREAPYVVAEHGRTERPGFLISLSDENDHLACAWAQTAEHSSLVGVGIDLASPADFGKREGTERFIALIFSERERALAAELYPDDPPLAFATLFGAKEAAFKATAAPLRAWYSTHTEALAYEVRDFGMTQRGIERGELRHGAAQRALDRMGITRIEIRHGAVDGLALVVALAYADKRNEEGHHENHSL